MQNITDCHNRHYIWVMTALAVVLTALFITSLLVGSVKIPAKEVVAILTGDSAQYEPWRIIVLETRLPMAITAMLSGAALAVAGLLLQTTFSNPLAGPSILGVSSGASLGVAVVMLSAGTMLDASIIGNIGVLLGAFLGASAVLLVMLLFSSVVKGNMMLLIIGILVSYITGSLISVLNFFSTQEGVHSYVIWGLGSFMGVTWEQTPMFSAVGIIALLWSLMLVKPLNAMLLGERYASNLGVNVKAVRNQLLALSGVLTAVVTAYCGPIEFVGLVVPHIARLLLRTSNHVRLLPATMLCGAMIALLCSIISVLPSNGILPVNAITPIIGVPIILYILINRKKIPYFN